MDCDDGDPEVSGKALLSKVEVTTETADAGGEVGGRQWGCCRPGVDGCVSPLCVWMGRHASSFAGLLNDVKGRLGMDISLSIICNIVDGDIGRIRFGPFGKGGGCDCGDDWRRLLSEFS